MTRIDPARRIFGSATVSDVDNTSKEANPHSGAPTMATTLISQDRDPTMRDRWRDYETWKVATKHRFREIAEELYVAIEIGEAKTSEYLTTLDSMMSAVLDNPDDLYVGIIDSITINGELIKDDFRRAAIDMAINASRGALSWGDRNIAEFFRPKIIEPVVVDDTATEVTPDVQSWNNAERDFYAEYESLLGYLSWTGTSRDQMSDNAAWYLSVEEALANELGQQSTDQEAAGTTTTVDPNEYQESALDPELQAVQEIGEQIVHVLSTYTLKHDVAVLFQYFLMMALDAKGWPVPRAVENSGEDIPEGFNAESWTEEAQILYIANMDTWIENLAAWDVFFEAVSSNYPDIEI